MKSYKSILMIAIILILTAAAFSSSLKNQFVNWDDDAHLLQNERVRSLALPNVKAMFTQLVEGTYIPVTVLSYAVEYHFFKYDPFTYHLTNLILHVTVTGLVYSLAISLQFSILAAGLAALIFGLHPIHVESVAWVTERKDVLYSLFYLLSTIFYVRYLKKESRAAYVFSLIFGLLSILSKAMALSLPLVLWAIDWVQNRKIEWKMFLDKIMYFLIIIPVAWITYSNNSNMLEPSNTIVRSLTIYIWSFCHYIWKFFYPVGFSPIHEMSEPITLTSPVYLLPLLFFILLLVLLIRFRRNRLFVFAVVFYFLSIFFLLRSNVVLFGAQMVSDRWMYLPCAGFCLWVGDYLCRTYLNIRKEAWVKKSLFIILTGGIFLWLGLSTFRQCQVWRDGGTLWTHALRYYPESAVANNNMADFMLKKGIVNQEVVAYCRQAVKSYPLYADAYVNLGSALAQLGEVEEASEHLKKALDLKPDHAVAHANLAAALFQQGNRAGAVVHAQKAIALGFNQPGVYYILEQAR